MRPSAYFLLLLGVLFQLIPGSVIGQPGASGDGRWTASLKAGWYLWDPYQMEELQGDHRVLTGLDIRLLREIAGRAGYHLVYDYIDWAPHQEALRTGERDIAGGAFYTPERAEFSYYSDPYRTEINVLIMRRGESGRVEFHGDDELLQRLANESFRIGTVDGYAYALPGINQLLREEGLQHRITRGESLQELFGLLTTGQIDLFFADRIVAQTVAWREGWQADVEEHPGFRAEADIHMIFSRESVSPSTVEDFNRALAEIRADGTHARIIREYLFPVLLNITIQRQWFLWIDILGTIAFAISGLVIARREKYSLLAAFVLAALPAMGGGLTRDLIVGRSPVGVLRTPVYITTVLLTVASGYLLLRLHAWFSHVRLALTDHLFARIVQVADAVGLATFTIIGVVVAVEMRCDPLWVWGPMLAFLTGAGGGILRDVLRSEAHIPTLKGEFYPEVAIIWGFLLAVLLHLQTTRADPVELMLSVVICVVGAFATRLAAIHWQWRSPMF